MRQPSFQAGVDDYRAGCRARFDQFPDDVAYEWGRQFAAIAPRNMTVRGINGQLSPAALRLYRKALKGEE
jgi:hypothetical protein